jgi:hypothetical protein
MTYGDYINGLIQTSTKVLSGKEITKKNAIFNVPTSTTNPLPILASWLIKNSILVFNSATINFRWPTNAAITLALKSANILNTDGLIIPFILVNTNVGSINLLKPGSDSINDPTGIFTSTIEMKSNEVRTYKVVSSVVGQTTTYTVYLVSGGNVEEEIVGATQFEYSPVSENYSVRNLDFVGTANNGPFITKIGGLITSNSNLGLGCISYEPYNSINYSSNTNINLSIIDGSTGLFNALGSSGINELFYFLSIGAIGASGINKIASDYNVNPSDVSDFFNDPTNNTPINNNSLEIYNDKLSIGVRYGATGINKWDFNQDGTLQFPDNTIQSTAFIGLNDGINETTVVGLNAFAGSTGVGNTAVGYNSFCNNSGLYNTAIGYSAMSSGGVGATGSNNTAIGTLALTLNTTGANNVAIGINSGSENTTGSNNTIIGSYADSNNCNGCVVLGTNAVPNADNQFVVGSDVFPAGIVGPINQGQPQPTFTSYWPVRINGIPYKIPLYP